MTDDWGSERDELGEAAESFVTRFRAGERPNVEEFVRSYPDQADELRKLLAVLVLLERHGHGSDDQELHGRTVASLPTPCEIGEFTIIREIGRGGMGVVYEAVQQSLGRHVALKVLSSPGLLHPTHLERFRLEARSAGRLHHSHIVPVFGVGEHDGLHYYAMQFIAGQSLDQVINALRKLRPDRGKELTAPLAHDELTELLASGLISGRFRDESATSAEGARTREASPNRDASNETSCTGAQTSTQLRLAMTAEFSSGSSGRPFYESVARVGLQAAEALAYAHTEGILHRDIKPSNLLLDAKGNVWVTDFGLVKADDTQSLTETGDLVGTLRYMAPERLEGWSDRRSDIYGLGATLYELLTLHTFFESANRAQLIDNIRHDQPQAPTKFDSAVPRDLETIVLKAVAKEPANRYHTADELAEDLRRYLADRPILARRATTKERFVRWCRRNPLVASLTATTAAALLIGTIASTWQAVRATRAEQLADERLRTEQTARQEADRALAAAELARAAETEQRQRAEAEREEADRQRGAAEANYQKAREAVDKYFTLVSENKLLEVPGLQPLRKDLLEEAMRFYEGNLPTRADDAALSADLALSYLRLSQIYLALDRVDKCVEAGGQALDIVERLRRDGPDTAEHLRKLAGFWKGQRWREGGIALPRNTAPAWLTLARLETNWKQLAEQFPDEAGFRIDLASTQTLMGALLTWSGNAKTGNRYYRAAIELGEKLLANDATNPQYRSDMANLKQLLADNLLVDTSQADEALVLTRDSVQLGESLVAEFPDIPSYRSALASSLISLGSQLRPAQPQEASESFGRAESLAASLAREFPGHVLFVEVWTKALVERALLESADAPDATGRFLEILDAEIRQRPDNEHFRGRIALAIWRLSNGQMSTNLSLRRDLLAERARNAYSELAKEYQRPRYWLALAESSRDLAAQCRDEGRVAEAVREFHISIDAIEKLIASGDEIDSRDLAVYLHLDHAFVLALSGQSEAALQSVERGVEIAQMLVEKFPGDLTLRLTRIRTQAVLARRLADAGRLEDARAIHETALSAIENTLHENPKDSVVRDGIAFSLSELANGWPARAAPDLCEALYQRCLALHTGLAEEFPHEPWHAEFAGHASNHLGWVVRRAGRLDEASACYTHAAEIFARLAAADISQRGGVYRDFHANSLAHLAETLALQGRFADAETAAQQCAQIYNALVDDAPHNTHYQVRMASAGNRYALLLIKLGDLEAYRQVCRGLCERVKENSSAEARHFVARTLALAPDAVAEWEPPIAQVLQLVEQDPLNADALIAAGAILYRAGRFEEAAVRLNEPAVANAGDSLTRNYARILLAMAHHRLGKVEEAQSEAATACAELDASSARSTEWDRHAPLEILRQEAETLLSAPPE